MNAVIQIGTSCYGARMKKFPALTDTEYTSEEHLTKARVGDGARESFLWERTCLLHCHHLISCVTLYIFWIN